MPDPALAIAIVCALVLLLQLCVFSFILGWFVSRLTVKPPQVPQAPTIQGIEDVGWEGEKVVDPYAEQMERIKAEFGKVNK